jgi:very-short-patch-repair endonuclease
MRRRFARRFDHVALTRLVPRAREMRAFPTRSEALLWQALREKKLGVRFRRQVVLHTFIVDFFAPSVGLVVEVDGGVHVGREPDDAERDRLLRGFGYRVVRVGAELVERDLAAAVAVVRAALGP